MAIGFPDINLFLVPFIQTLCISNFQQQKEVVFSRRIKLNGSVTDRYWWLCKGGWAPNHFYFNFCRKLTLDLHLLSRSSPGGATSCGAPMLLLFYIQYF
jgi:hypothetical protein